MVVYLDDILVYSKTPQEHEVHLRKVLSLLEKEQFYAKLDKCSFNKPELKFLGHIIGRHGMKVDPKKVEVVQNWPLPTDATQIRSFLGLTNYFRKFIQGYSTLAAPLMSLTNKGVVVKDEWKEDHTKCFQALKQALITAPLLVLPDFTKQFELISDASLLGTGAILLQEGKVVAYTSKKFSPAERNYTTTEQELLGVINALHDWRCYLEGSHFRVVTDHNPLVYLQTQAHISRRQARWVEYMAQFDFEWEYRPGRNNVADPVSRNPLLLTEETINVCLGITAQTKRKPRSEQPDVTMLMARITEGYKVDENIKHSCPKDATFDGQFWTHGGRVIVPNEGTLREEIIGLNHALSFTGHVGRRKTLDLISRTFYWKGMTEDVNKYIDRCFSCQSNKSSNKKTAGLYQPVEIPDRPWDCISVDFVVALPTTEQGHDAMVVFVDKLTKYVHVAPTTTTATAADFATIFMDVIFRNHGLPKKIVSDRDSKFTGKFWTEVCRIMQIQQATSTSFHPQTDGQTERMNRTIEDMMRHFINPFHNDWHMHLGMVEFAINNSKQESTGMTPFFLNTGQHPRTPIMLQLETTVPYATQNMMDYNERLQRAKTCLEAAQQRQAKYANRSRRDVKYSLDDQVMLSTRNLKFKTGGVPKFTPKWVGPFKVTKVIGPGYETGHVSRVTAVELDLPPLMKVHKVFNVSLVKPCPVGGFKNIHPIPLHFDHDGAPLWSVERLLDVRTRTSKARAGRGKPKTERSFLVKWTGYGVEHNSWEPETHIVDKTLIDDFYKSRGKDIPMSEAKKRPGQIKDPGTLAAKSAKATPRERVYGKHVPIRRSMRSTTQS